MPGIFHKPSARRDFLKVTAAAGAAALVSGCRSTAKLDAGARNQKQFHLALLSDTHIPADQKNGHRGFNPWENLKQVVPQVVETEPEAVIICGDAARLEGLEGDYKELRGLLEPVAATTPIFIGLGNHDDRANFNKVFTHSAGHQAGVENKHVVVIEEELLNIVVLDSLMYVNKVPGLLGKEQRAWLSEFLATKSEKPVVLFVHHTLEDGDGDLLDAKSLFELITPHRQVKAIFFGHSHVWALTKRDGIELVNLPAVGYNFREQDPVGWVDARFDADGVNLTLRAIGGNKTEDRRLTRLNWRA
jgi:3',5'-cyclic AMP phosphodiesterase CpdA